jgi:3-oxoacyl-[acyl-carrier protein] reductase
MSASVSPGATAEEAQERKRAQAADRSSLAGKVAIVTGAARGIGRAVALGLADEGAAVVMTDVDPIEAPKRHPGRGELLTHRGDITNPADVRSAVAAATTGLGGIDIVVNVAGILGAAPAHQVTLSEWDRLIGAPLVGTLNLLAAVRGPMAERGGGAIVGFTSASALTGAGHMVGYSAGKCAAIGLVRALAGELAPLGIRINAVSPSAATRMLAVAPANSSDASEEIPPAFAAREPEQVARFVGYLVSPRASDVTGRVFLATGGYLIEYGPPRLYKQFTVPEPAGIGEVANGLRWVLGRPALDRIGYGPTRRFEIDGVNAHIADV